MLQHPRPIAAPAVACIVGRVLATSLIAATVAASAALADPSFLRSLDFDGDGVVLVDEAIALRNLQFNEIDLNGDDKISPDEFDASLRAAQARYAQMGQSYQAQNASPGRIDAFTFADTDADGFISRREYNHHSARLAHSLDRDNDGIISDADLSH